jgi:hypothetical protein
MAAAEQTHNAPEPFEVPEGGLASFLTATVGDWAEADNDDYIPAQGIAQVKSIAETSLLSMVVMKTNIWSMLRKAKRSFPQKFWTQTPD